MKQHPIPEDGASLSPSPTFDPTGVPQLDFVLGGGLPRGTLIAVLGPPGSGKTTLVCQIAFAVAARGQQVLLLTALSETTDKLVQHLQRFRFYDPHLLGSHVQVFSIEQFLVQDTATAIQEIAEAIARTQASLVVLDGFQVFRDLADSASATRHALYALGTRLSLQGITTLLTSEAAPRDPALFPEMTSADGLIGLYYSLEGVRAFRSLEMIKLRGNAPVLGRHSLLLNEEGIQVFPRLEVLARSPSVESWPVAVEHVPPPERASFDLAELDQLLGGGLTRQTSTLLTGSLGVGKTLLALQFALAGIRQGEPVLFLSFRETGEQLIQKANAFSMGEHFQAALAAGKLILHRWEPVEVDPDQMASMLLATIEQMGARRLILDSITELARAVEESSGAERVANYLAALLAALRVRGVTLLATKEVSKDATVHLDFSEDVLAILAENVLLMQQVTYHRRRHRILSVLKMRFSSYDSRLRELLIDPPQGIHILKPEESGGDVLAGLTEQQLKGEEKETPSQPSKDAAPVPSAQHPQRAETPMILIADDEEPVVELLEAFVRDLGYTPLVARNGQQALRLANENWPSLVLTDLMMPMLSGADFVTALRAEASTQGREMPTVVLFTAGQLRTAKHWQVDAVISKPFDLGKLERLIHRLLQPSQEAHPA